MATSGVSTYNVTGTQIITEAAELAGVIAPGQTLSANDTTSVLRTLEMMIKAWQGEGIGVWKNTETALFQSYGGYEYSIGPSGNNSTKTWVKTEIATAADSGDLTITVDSDTDMTTGDYIGIELDDGTLQWTTINGVPAADVVTITAALTDDVAVDNHVYTYTTKTPRPIEIVEARLVRPDGTDTPINIISRQSYMNLASKTSTGAANQIYYDPKLTNGKLYVWPACADVQYYLKFTARVPIEDMDVVGNNPDFGQEWLLPIAWGLAVLVAPKFGEALSKDFVMNAIIMKANASASDRDMGSIYFGVRTR